MLRTVYGQLHGKRTGGHNDEAGGQLLMVYGDGMAVREPGTPPYPINAGLLQPALSVELFQAFQGSLTHAFIGIIFDDAFKHFRVAFG